jgi:hypothetical protein
MNKLYQVVGESDDGFSLDGQTFDNFTDADMEAHLLGLEFPNNEYWVERIK